MAEAQILWFRNDLRLTDHRALLAAVHAGPVAPVFVLDDETPGAWRIGAASRWWLHQSLGALAATIASKGARLILLRGRPEAVLPSLAQTLGEAHVHATEQFEPAAKAQTHAVGLRLPLTLHPGQTLADPASVLTGQGGRYRVFTPFWRALQRQMPPPAPLPAPARLTMAKGAPEGDRLGDWGLLPSHPNRAKGWEQEWTAGEAGARAALEAFAAHIHGYHEGRNLPAAPGTSRLSPHLHLGEISPSQVWHAAHAAAGNTAEPFLREIAWRDFALGILDQYPHSPDQPMRGQFAHFPHRNAAVDLAGWQHGKTGYPIVDAGMRQLWQTGWMHNRVRMIASSFLVKHLLIDWREGERWFWNTLVDADLANNALGWQWIMGSGTDSQPFIRIFEPVTQGRRHDPTGDYVRRWVPELNGLPTSVIHAPWEASPLELQAAGVRLGITYPERIVDHAHARARALETFAHLRA
jgi:deoxyribodipyrimidine photo-lyase